MNYRKRHSLRNKLINDTEFFLDYALDKHSPCGHGTSREENPVESALNRLVQEISRHARLKFRPPSR